MNTEPPTGDDLTQMLVAMKHHVLTAAGPQDTPPRPARTGRRVGVVIGIIAVLGIGATSGAVALGMVPRPFTAAPAPTTTTTPEPTTEPTPSSAPVISTPTTTPTPTSTRKPYALDDPSTWTISGTEVGPVAIGGDFTAETDDLGQGTVRAADGGDCPAPEYGSWRLSDAVTIEVEADRGGVVRVVRVISTDPGVEAPDPSLPRPTTAGGFGLGSTISQLRAEYPDVHPEADGQAAPWAIWEASDQGGTLHFETGPDGETVFGMSIGDSSLLPHAECD